MFQDIIGNDTVKRQLQQLVEHKCVPHLLLFTGSEGIGKALFARLMAATWLESPSARSSFLPDLFIATCEGKTGMHSIASLRRLIDEVNLAPYASSRKAFIIDDAERMLPSSSNALLKTLEEPPKNTLIILVTSAPEKLLPTIVSRCQIVRFCPLSDEERAKVRSLSPPDSQATNCQSDVQERLFAFLLAGRIEFHEISAECKEIHKQLETKKKSHESLLKEQYGAQMKELPTAARQQIEQEIEGALHLAWMREVNAILYTIQAFFRDLVAVGADCKPLRSDREEELLTAFNQGYSVPVEHVMKLVQQAKLSIERSMPLQNALETLFLQLHT